jgi:hypothetical protein
MENLKCIHCDAGLNYNPLQYRCGARPSVCSGCQRKRRQEYERTHISKLPPRNYRIQKVIQSLRAGEIIKLDDFKKFDFKTKKTLSRAIHRERDKGLPIKTSAFYHL